MYTQTTAFNKIARLTKRLRIIQGGTSASKTISILLYLIAKAQTDKNKTLTSVVAESIPHLKRGAMRDFKNILQAHGYWKDDNWNATDSIYTFETGSQIEFFSSDNGDKLRGARRDRLFINECNNVTLEAFMQLEVRTKEFVFLDYNPTNEFWVYTEILNKREDYDFLIVTYKDNEGLSPEIVSAIEQRRSNTAWFKVYGEGQLGVVEGRIYKDWQIIDDIPHEARLERRGIDFGYTNDPTAIVDVYYYNGGYILDEVCYQKGLSNKQIADLINNLPKVLCIADSAEPKSIDELILYGLNVVPTVKGPDSIRQGIQKVQFQRISMTKRSTNLIKEFRNYLWRVDKNGKTLNEPEGGLDHACFTADTKIEVPIGEEITKMFTGKKEVYLFMGSKVTADHPYLTQRGFVRLDALRYSDRIVLWKNKLLMELSLDDTQTQTGVSLRTITHLLLRNLSAIKQNVYTGIYGKNTMGKSLKVFTSTTKMVIHLITIYLISNLSHLKNTIPSTIKKCYLNGKQIFKTLYKKLVNGARLKKEKSLEENGVYSIQSISLDIKSKGIVTNAINFILQKHQQENTATIIAKLKHLGKEDVYATSTTSGFFVANGVVVSNCDAVRYAINSIVNPLSQQDKILKQQQVFANRLANQKSYNI